MSACVVIVNWHGWRDTIECLESLLRTTDRGKPIIVCDNASEDGSLEKIRAWAEGDLFVEPSGDPRLRAYVLPPVAKPVAYVEYDRATAESGGNPEEQDVPLVLVRTGGNLGFAGGTNVGLRYALARGDLEHAWILNNDTVVPEGALQHLLDAAAADPRLGMVGSSLMYYDHPDQIQTLGGVRYNRWLARTNPIRAGEPLENVDPEAVVEQMDYVAGASMLVSREFLLQVGLMSEDYFLYFEELDWAMRARGRFRLGYAVGSVVYHKEGVSIGGANRDPRNKSWSADYHSVRNRIRFTRRFAPGALPTVYLTLLAALVRRIQRGQWDRARMIAKLCLTA